MASLDLELLNRRLSRLRQDHENRLLMAHSGALKSIDVNRRATVATAFDQVRHDSQAGLVDYCQQVHAEVLSFVEETAPRTSEIEVNPVVDCAAHQLDADFYLKRFDDFGKSVVRHFGRAGATVDLSAFSLDHSRALLHAGTSDFITRFRSSLRDDLELVSRKRNALEEDKDQTASSGGPVWLTTTNLVFGAVGAIAGGFAIYAFFFPPATTPTTTSAAATAHQPMAASESPYQSASQVAGPVVGSASAAGQAQRAQSVQ